MAMTDNQKISNVYKKLLGVAETSIDKAFFEEPFKTGIIVTPDMIWRDGAALPATAPDIQTHSEVLDGDTLVFGDDGVVRYMQELQLKPIDGAPKAFFHEQLKNAITFNFDPAGSYVFKLKNSAGFDIAFGIQDWVVDPVAGVLTFYGSNLASIGVSQAQPPKITFYKYIGRLGMSSGDGSGADLPIADIDTLLYRMGYPTHLARFNVRGGAGTKVYELPSIDGDLSTGTVLLKENMNTAIDDIGIVDGGEH